MAASADAVFHALGDPTRRAVLELVGRTGPATATELAARLPVSRQAVVKHLDTLRAAGLVDSNKSGRDVRYELRAAPLESAAAWMERVGSAWDDRLALLTARAATRPRPKKARKLTG